jgi:hypothetical protein
VARVGCLSNEMTNWVELCLFVIIVTSLALIMLELANINKRLDRLEREE